jgi:malonyl-CoA decarboxylase
MALQELRASVRERLAAPGAIPIADDLAKDVERLCAAYLMQTAPREPGMSDPVAKFHLNNGARLERINVSADLSAKGGRQSLGLMVNYAYDLDDIETNHEKFVAGQVIAARQVKALLG